MSAVRRSLISCLWTRNAAPAFIMAVVGLSLPGSLSCDACSSRGYLPVSWQRSRESLRAVFFSILCSKSRYGEDGGYLGMEIRILGTGCANCHKLEALVRDVISEMEATAHIAEVKDVKEIVSYGVIATPGLVIDGLVRCSGRVPSKSEVVSWVGTALAMED